MLDPPDAYDVALFINWTLISHPHSHIIILVLNQHR